MEINRNLTWSLSLNVKKAQAYLMKLKRDRYSKTLFIHEETSTQKLMADKIDY